MANGSTLRNGLSAVRPAPWRRPSLRSSRRRSMRRGAREQPTTLPPSPWHARPSRSRPASAGPPLVAWQEQTGAARATHPHGRAGAQALRLRWAVLSAWGRWGAAVWPSREGVPLFARKALALPRPVCPLNPPPCRAPVCAGRRRGVAERAACRGVGRAVDGGAPRDPRLQDGGFRVYRLPEERQGADVQRAVVSALLCAEHVTEHGMDARIPRARRPTGKPGRCWAASRAWRHGGLSGS
eukprot:3878877-Prymnesium_polylepis.1